MSVMGCKGWSWCYHILVVAFYVYGTAAQNLSDATLAQVEARLAEGATHRFAVLFSHFQKLKHSTTSSE